MLGTKINIIYQQFGPGWWVS